MAEIFDSADERKMLQKIAGVWGPVNIPTSDRPMEMCCRLDKCKEFPNFSSIANISYFFHLA
jgi:hypothetical protein